MSAEVLRRAAALMRERAEKATSGPWEFRPRRGFQSMSENPATIGFLDDAGYFVMLREGTWCTESDMSYLASWHPAVAVAVSRLLDAVVEHIASHDCEAHCEPGGCAESRDAYDLARAYLGGAA